MSLHPLAGKPVPAELLTNTSRVVAEYYANAPDPENESALVAFGTSGHRGTSLDCTFTETHILAISQAVSEYRVQQGITGPLFIGMDTHALSEAAIITALEVFAANDVTVMVQEGRGYTPTPVISHAVLTWNRDAASRGSDARADGVVITPSHNPPSDGGFKYNPPSGGPADTDCTSRIQQRANDIIRDGLRDVKRMTFAKASASEFVKSYDYIRPYVDDLENVIDMDALGHSGLRIGVDPMGGSGIGYWEPIAERYGLHLSIVNKKVDPTFSFMTVDKDGKVRMDCSSPYAMAGLIQLREKFDVAFGNDPDNDRHGIVTRSGLMNPNHYLAAAIKYLFTHRKGWSSDAAIGKTLVSSAMIDRVAAKLGRRLHEVPVGFKWFVEPLLTGTCAFGGEESAGASFLRKDGSVWTTDKDGIIMDLLAAEMLATMGKDPMSLYRELTAEFGAPVYERMDAAATPEQRAAFKSLTPEMVTADTLAGDRITARLTDAPGNGAPIGGLKVVTERGWFAARPSGTEPIYKIYAESFEDVTHLRAIQTEAKAIVSEAFEKSGS